MANRDFGSSLVWAGIGLLFCIGALRYKLIYLGGYGPGFYPFLTGCLLVCLSLALWTASWKKSGSAQETFPGSEGLRRVLLAVGALFGYGLLLPYAGFLVTTFLLMLLLLRFVVPGRWAGVLLTALLTTAGCYVLFTLWLGVQMPRGILR